MVRRHVVLTVQTTLAGRGENLHGLENTKGSPRFAIDDDTWLSHTPPAARPSHRCRVGPPEVGHLDGDEDA